MGTKTNPGKFDCLSIALPDEPLFIILARDPDFFEFVATWADRRVNAIMCGARPGEDLKKVNEARHVAEAGRNWRRNNNGVWRL